MTSIDVTTDMGLLRSQADDGLLTFRNVPYAAPPVGLRRFRPPQPPQPWTGVRDARTDGPVCPQPPSRLSMVVGDFEATQGEDCLSLTIWTPALDQQLPVLMWFHGGGYSSGAGSLAWYDGARLAREAQAVVVGVNSRLGALGYLYTPQLSPGNLGLADQIAALRWVNQHIGAFGGDASRVTLMGQSAGAHSILCMLASPSVRPLVRRTVLLSTPFGMRTLPAETAALHGQAFVQQLGIDENDPDALEQLQAAPIDALLAAQQMVVRHFSRPGNPTPIFGPAALGELPRTEDFDEVVKAAASDLEVLLGTNREEMQAFYPYDPRLQALDPAGLAGELFGSSAPRRLQQASQKRPGASAVQLLSDAQTRHYFREGAWGLAAAARRAWLYQFDWAARPEIGACHCIDLPFVFSNFGAYNDAPMLQGADGQRQALSKVFREAIARFVNGGDPNHANLPDWPAFSADQPLALHFNSLIEVY